MYLWSIGPIINASYQHGCLPCSKVSKDLAHGTLGHVIEHGQVKGSQMTLNVQHESLFKLILRATM